MVRITMRDLRVEGEGWRNYVEERHLTACLGG